MVLYSNFTSLAIFGLLGFLRRQLKIKFIATLLRAAKKKGGDSSRVQSQLRNVRQIQAARLAFAALLEDGSVPWGSIEGLGFRI